MSLDLDQLRRAGGPTAVLRGDRRSGAIFSADDTKRFLLWRVFDPLLTPAGSEKLAHFVMLNPSVADHEKPDPTITRCCGFARAWGCDGVIVSNLSPVRSTDPKGLLPHLPGLLTRPNADAIIAAASVCHVTVCAWGRQGSPRRLGAAIEEAGRKVVALLELHEVRAHVLALTDDGLAPRHPLYLRGDLMPKVWA